MGIFSAIGTALKNPDVQDRLAAIGATLQGDTKAAEQYQHRSAQRQAAEATAAKLEALAQTEAAGGLPQVGAAVPALPATSWELPSDGAVRLPGPLSPVTVRELPQLGAPNSDAPRTPPIAPEPQATAPTAPPVPRSVYMEMLPQLIRASGRGADVGGLASMLQHEDYVRSLPQKDQAMARAAGVPNYASWQYQSNKPVYNETTPGNTWGRYDPASGAYTPIYTAPARPEPVTTERVVGAIIAKRAQGQELTPAEQSIYDRWENGAPKEQKPPGTSQIVGAVLAKVQKDGVESLSPGEKLIWDRYNRNDMGGLAALLGGGGDALDDEEGAAPAAAAAAAPAARPAAGLPQKPAPQLPTGKPGTTTANPINVRTPDEARKLKPGTYFRDPAGNIRQR